MMHGSDFSVFGHVPTASELEAAIPVPPLEREIEVFWAGYCSALVDAGADPDAADVIASSLSASAVLMGAEGIATAE